jgi:hypothetical protein
VEPEGYLVSPAAMVSQSLRAVTAVKVAMVLRQRPLALLVAAVAMVATADQLAMAATEAMPATVLPVQQGLMARNQLNRAPMAETAVRAAMEEQAAKVGRSRATEVKAETAATEAKAAKAVVVSRVQMRRHLGLTVKMAVMAVMAVTAPSAVMEEVAAQQSALATLD